MGSLVAMGFFWRVRMGGTLLPCFACVAAASSEWGLVLAVRDGKETKIFGQSFQGAPLLIFRLLHH